MIITRSVFALYWGWTSCFLPLRVCLWLFNVADPAPAFQSPFSLQWAADMTLNIWWKQITILPAVEAFSKSPFSQQELNHHNNEIHLKPVSRSLAKESLHLWHFYRQLFSAVEVPELSLKVRWKFSFCVFDYEIMEFKCHKKFVWAIIW